MEINNQIKKYRTAMNLSQEELGEKVYVTRQTVSNWETGKSYPDIHSLLLLSSLFEVSLDQLIKGDIEVMKKEINVDKYGFILYDTERERQHGKLYSHMHYGNEKTLEDVIISRHYAHKGLLKDLAKHKEIENKFQNIP